MRPKSTASAKAAGSSRMPGASKVMTPSLAGDSRERQDGEGRQDEQEGCMGLAGESDRVGASIALQLAREQRDEGRGEGTLGEQTAEEIRQLERHEEGVGHHARTQHCR